MDLPEQDFRASHSMVNLDHLAPRLVSLFEYHLMLRDAKYFGQKCHQHGISRSFHRRRGESDF